MIRISKTDINEDEFLVSEHLIAGIECFFVRARDITSKWTQDNLHLRSSIWDKDGLPVSLSYKKFFNLNEKPDIDPFNGDLSNTSLMIKEDGSTLIVSKYKNQLILRTRGTVDAHAMPNSDELEVFKRDILPKLPKEDNWDKSWIFEWTSPKNRIILDYGKEPTFILTNIINHSDYSLTLQKDLDYIASCLSLKRPQRFSNYTSIEGLVKDVEKLEGQEGICLYYNNDQHIRKLKGLWYLKLHSFKSQCSLKTITELYLQWGRPSREKIEELITKELDFECLTYSKSFIDSLYSEVPHAALKIENVKTFVENGASLDQKEFAIMTNKIYTDYCKPLAFALRKGVPTQDIEDKLLKSLLNLI